jgi:hypothetical protein
LGRYRLNNARISTTISTKHSALLKKQAEKYGSQQKALEHALECQENENNSKPISKLSPEEEMTMRIVQSKLACLVEKQGLKHILENLNMKPYLTILNNDKLLQYQLEVYFQKPLKDCSLKEVMDGMIVNAKLGNWFETLTYTDDGDHYTFNATHNLGLNCSKINETLFEGLFKSYGVRVNITTSERTIFMKIYKNG